MGLAFIGALAFLGLQLRKKNAARAPLMTYTPAQLYGHRGGDGDWQHQYQHGMQAQEMETQGKPSEMVGEGFAHEVPG